MCIMKGGRGMGDEEGKVRGGGRAWKTRRNLRERVKTVKKITNDREQYRQQVPVTHAEIFD